jgi:hypothetical protein
LHVNGKEATVSPLLCSVLLMVNISWWCVVCCWWWIFVGDVYCVVE